MAETVTAADKPAARRFVDTSDIFWMAAFIFVIHKFDLIDAIRFDSRIHRLFIVF